MATQEEMKAQLKELMEIPENLLCLDCNDKRPMWASLIVPPPNAPFKEPIGCFCCYQCSGAHRRMGVHICFVRSTNLDEWKEKEMKAMKDGGNKYLNSLFEANLSATQESRLKPNNKTEMEERCKFIFDKYQNRKWYDPAGSSGKAEKKRSVFVPPTPITETPAEAVAAAAEDDFFASRTGFASPTNGGKNGAVAAEIHFDPNVPLKPPEVEVQMDAFPEPKNSMDEFPEPKNTFQEQNVANDPFAESAFPGSAFNTKPDAFEPFATGGFDPFEQSDFGDSAFGIQATLARKNSKMMVMQDIITLDMDRENPNPKPKSISKSSRSKGRTQQQNNRKSSSTHELRGRERDKLKRSSQHSESTRSEQRSIRRSDSKDSDDANRSSRRRPVSRNKSMGSDDGARPPRRRPERTGSDEGENIRQKDDRSETSRSEVSSRSARPPRAEVRRGVARTKSMDHDDLGMGNRSRSQSTNRRPMRRSTSDNLQESVASFGEASVNSSDSGLRVPESPRSRPRRSGRTRIPRESAGSNDREDNENDNIDDEIHSKEDPSSRRRDDDRSRQRRSPRQGSHSESRSPSPNPPEPPRDNRRSKTRRSPGPSSRGDEKPISSRRIPTVRDEKKDRRPGRRSSIADASPKRSPAGRRSPRLKEAVEDLCI